MRLRRDQLDNLVSRISQLVADFANVDDPHGDPYAMLLLLHRRPPLQAPP